MFLFPTRARYLRSCGYHRNTAQWKRNRALVSTVRTVTDEVERRATVAAVIGENLRRVREDRRQTQDEASRYLHGHGLPWSRERIYTIELGNRGTVSVEELAVLSHAYGVPLSEWFAGDGEVDLSPTTYVERWRLRDFLDAGGERALVPLHHLGAPVERAAGIGDAERKVAARLDRTAAEVVSAGLELWGRTVTEERDRRLGDTFDLPTRTVQAKRGSITRALVRELGAHLEGKS